jgi:hypothetical protein
MARTRRCGSRENRDAEYLPSCIDQGEEEVRDQFRRLIGSSTHPENAPTYQCLVWFVLGNRALRRSANANTPARGYTLRRRATHSKPAVWSCTGGRVRMRRNETNRCDDSRHRSYEKVSLAPPACAVRARTMRRNRQHSLLGHDGRWSVGGRDGEEETESEGVSGQRGSGSVEDGCDELDGREGTERVDDEVQRGEQTSATHRN